VVSEVRRDQWAKAAKSCGDAVGVVNLVLLIFGEPTTLTLGLAVVLAPLTLALALKVTAFLACSCVSIALGNRQERTELLVCAIAAVQPPGAGERYREAMLAEIRFAPACQVRALANNLLITGPRTILAAWARLPSLLWKRLPRKRRAQ
jgi:hypothetical protein